MKKAIDESMHLEKDWFKEAAEVKTIEDYTKFTNHILNDYEHDYGTACRAVAACALAGAWLGCEKEGLSGFQAGFVMWDFIRHWAKSSNVCGMKLIDYDDFLYPQYEHKFQKTISKETWHAIQEEAKKKLKDSPEACENVRHHWEKNFTRFYSVWI